MPQYETKQKYTAPPIIEAIVQIVFADSLSETRLQKLIKRSRKDYYNALSQKTIEAKIDVPSEKATFKSSPQSKLSSEDEADILLLTKNATTWQRLAPYQGWDAFEQRIYRDLLINFDLFGPRKISRIGVRYINRLDIPGTAPITHYEKYLNINLSLPDHWPVDQYSWRFDRTFPNQLLAIVQSAIVPPEVPKTVAIALDIDIVAGKDLPLKLDDVILKLREMRIQKNEIFETIVTDLAKESFLHAP